MQPNPYESPLSPGDPLSSARGREPKPFKVSGMGATVGIILGAATGMVGGLLAGNLPLCILVGLAVGSTFGLAYDRRK